jgi:hypothetical protein
VAATIGVVYMLHLGLAQQQFNGPWPVNPPGTPLFAALGMWDGSWYIRIAGHGYTTLLHPVDNFTPTVAFLPLLPVLLRIVNFLTGLNYLYAGVLLSFVVGAIASIGVWLLARRLTDAATADRATALWCFFPGAITLSMVYTEGLVAVLAVVCLFALMRKRWLIAGLAAAGASAAAPEGLALTACCVWAAGTAILAWPSRPALLGGSELSVWDSQVVSGRRQAVDPGGEVADGNRGQDGRDRSATRFAGRPGRRWLALVAPILAPLGWIAYQTYLWRRTGDPTFWYQVENNFWHGGFHLWTATGDKARLAFEHPGVPDYLIPTLGLFVLAAAAILLWRWKPPAVVTIYAAVAMGMVLCSGPLGARPRFFIAAFPFIVALARPVRGPAFSGLLGTSAACLGLLTLILAAGINQTLAFTP